MLRIRLTDSKQEDAVIDAIQRERTDEYHEVVESTRQFHEELEFERRRGRAMYVPHRRGCRGSSVGRRQPSSDGPASIAALTRAPSLSKQCRGLAESLARACRKRIVTSLSATVNA
jgi:hypothetical protein